jgi:hypothetical protein
VGAHEKLTNFIEIQCAIRACCLAEPKSAVVRESLVPIITPKKPRSAKMKNYVRQIAAGLTLGIFVLPAFTPSAQAQNHWWYYGCPRGPIPQAPGKIPNPGTAGWARYRSCLQQYLSVSPQQSARLAPILAGEGQKVIAIRENNSLSKVQKIQGVNALQRQSDPQLKAILSSAQYEKLKVAREQAIRWVTQARLGWQ